MASQEEEKLQSSPLEEKAENYERKEQEHLTEKTPNKWEKLQEEISSLKDQYLRKQAEFENFRKRMSKEKEDLVHYANKQLMEDVIQLIDNFDRALTSVGEGKDFEKLYEGISLVRTSFLSSMASKYHLEAFGKEGDIFDPEKYEAISVEIDPNVESPLIKEVFQKGYSVQGRIIRTARVKVIQS